MLLMIDAGNTNTLFGMSSLNSDEAVSMTWRVSSNRERMPDEWFALLSPFLEAARLQGTPLEGVIISSVVPAITNALIELCQRRLDSQPMIVTSNLDLGITIKTDNPSEVGTDRLVNSAYAYARYGGPVVVVDLGTATKIEAIDQTGSFLGGVIAPGLGVTLDALAGRAARLYSVELKVPERAIGRNTVGAVQSGVVLGHVAMIEGMVTRVWDELGGRGRVILTGGYSAAIANSTAIISDHVPDLTLRGLRFVYARNSPDPTIAPGETTP